MSQEYSLGEVNGHVVGRILKETVRRASVAIRIERLVFESHVKAGHSGNMDDVFTSADKKAQMIYLQTLSECFPLCGVVAEEDLLTIPASGVLNAYFTVDPLDGTKAYIRRQSHGIGTMISLVYEGEIISAYVGDINTEEVYGYRPGSDKVHRITRLDIVELLDSRPNSNISQGFVLLRDSPERYSGATRAILPNFKSYEVMGSSIGTWMARLWKREVVAVIMDPGYETPWDATPIIGISQKLGYVFLRSTDNCSWEEYSPVVSRNKYRRDHDTLVIHRNDLNLS